MRRLVRAAWWAALVWVVIFWRLGYPSLLDPDEAHYAQITREMLSRREWLVPLLDGTPYIDKPVFFHWLQGLSFGTLGVTEFAARLPSAVAALVLTWITYWTGRELFADRETGERAAMMFLTMPGTFVLGSVGLFDMTFATLLFGAVALLLAAAACGRWRLEWVGYALLSLAIMIKGPVALLLLATAFVLAVIAVPAARPGLGRLRWFLGPFVALAVAAPWFLWMWWHFGDAFIERYVVEGNVWYLTHPFPFRSPNHFFYVRTFFGAFLPWSLLVAGRALGRVTGRRTGTVQFGTAESLLWVWTITVVGVFTAARFKLDSYIYPAAPAICLIAARAWASARRDDEATFCERAAHGAIALVLVGLAVVLGLSMFDLDLRISPWAIALPISLVTGGAIFGVKLYADGWRPPSSLATVVATLLAVYASVVLFGYPALEQTRPTPDLARWISSHKPPDSPIGVFQLAQWEASLRFYSGRRIERLDDEAQLRTFLAGSFSGAVVMWRGHAEEFRAKGLPLHVVFGCDAVVATSGRGLRRQEWGELVVVDASTATPGATSGEGGL